MGKLVVTEFITLDGVMEDPGGGEPFDRGGWAFQFERGAEGDKFKLDETLEAEALLLGRVTYEGCAAAANDSSGTRSPRSRSACSSRGRSATPASSSPGSNRLPREGGAVAEVHHAVAETALVQ